MSDTIKGIYRDDNDWTPIMTLQFLYRLFVFFLCLFYSLSATAIDINERQKLVAYQASWGPTDNIDYKNLSHIIYSFATPFSNGKIMPLSSEDDRKLRNLIQKSHISNTKVLLAIGGWNNGDDSGFEKLTQSSDSIDNFTRALLKLVKTYQLDGIDINWEYPDSPKKWNKLLDALAPQLKSRGKLLTAAVPAYGTNADNIGSLEQLDFANVMMYECQCGDEEAPLWQTEKSLKYWKGRGLDDQRLIIGIPFYGGGGQDIARQQAKS